MIKDWCYVDVVQTKGARTKRETELDAYTQTHTATRVTNADDHTSHVENSEREQEQIFRLTSFLLLDSSPRDESIN